jgi:putative oxidoreductase
VNQSQRASNWLSSANVSLSASASLVGRLLLAYLFIGAAIYHLRHWGATVQDMQQHGVPAPMLLLAIALAISSLASLALVIGWNSRAAAYILAGYSVIVSSILHNPLHMDAPGGFIDFVMFTKDLAMAGALLALADALGRTGTAAGR